MGDSSEGGFDTNDRVCIRLGFAAGSRIHTPMGLEAVVVGAKNGRLYVRYEESNQYGVGYQPIAPLPFSTPADLNTFGYRLIQPAERILRDAGQRRSLMLYEVLGSKFLPHIIPDLPSPPSSECQFSVLDDVACNCRSRCRCLCVCQYQCRHPRHRHHNSLNIPSELANGLPSHKAGVHLDSLVDPYPTSHSLSPVRPSLRPVLEPLNARGGEKECVIHGKGSPYPERALYPPLPSKATKLHPIRPAAYYPPLSLSPLPLPSSLS